MSTQWAAIISLGAFLVACGIACLIDKWLQRTPRNRRRKSKLPRGVMPDPWSGAIVKTAPGPYFVQKWDPDMGALYRSLVKGTTNVIDLNTFRSNQRGHSNLSRS